MILFIYLFYNVLLFVWLSTVHVFISFIKAEWPPPIIPLNTIAILFQVYIMKRTCGKFFCIYVNHTAKVRKGKSTIFIDEVVLEIDLKIRHF
jgi:hypothetical protein